MAPPTNKHSPWLKRVLVPFWAFRMFFMIIIVGLYAWALSIIGENRDALEDDGVLTGGKMALIIVWFILLVICLLLDIVAITLFARHNLKPRTFLIFNVIQTTIWLVATILAIIGAVRSRSGGVVLDILILLSFVGLLVYAAIIFHRTRRGGAYAPAHNPTNFGSTAYDNQTAHNPDAYTPYGSHSAPVELHQTATHAGAAGDYYNPSHAQQQQTYYSSQSVRQTAQKPVPVRGI